MSENLTPKFCAKYPTSHREAGSLKTFLDTDYADSQSFLPRIARISANFLKNSRELAEFAATVLDFVQVLFLISVLIREIRVVHIQMLRVPRWVVA